MSNEKTEILKEYQEAVSSYVEFRDEGATDCLSSIRKGMNEIYERGTDAGISSEEFYNIDCEHGLA